MFQTHFRLRFVKGEVSRRPLPSGYPSASSPRAIPTPPPLELSRRPSPRAIPAPPLLGLSRRPLPSGYHGAPSPRAIPAPPLIGLSRRPLSSGYPSAPSLRAMPLNSNTWSHCHNLPFSGLQRQYKDPVVISPSKGGLSPL